jgi:hypothetical protein
LLGRQDWPTSLTFSSEVAGSGSAATQTRTVKPFTAIDLTGASDVTVRVGAKQTVRVQADENLIDRVKTGVQNGVLVVSERGTFVRTLPMSVEVTVPTLESARLIGSGMISVEGIQAQRFTAELAGSGILTITGTADHLDAKLAGSGNMQLGQLAARSVVASVPGSGRLEVQATQALDASISGSGVIVYGGRPATVKQSVHGSGAIQPR